MPATQPSELKPADTDGELKPESNYKLVSRVVNYPVVSNMWNSATQYYTSAKEKSTIVKYGCSIVETNLERGVKLVEPVLNNEHVRKYSEPILTRVDEIGCRQLDKIENVSEKIAESYTSSKQMLENKVATITNDIKSTTNTIVEMSKHTIEEKVVPPVDNYLKTSVLSVPINAALNVTEKVVDTILPATVEEKDKALDEKIVAEPTGPVIRAGKMTKKYQKRAMDKLQNLSLRTPAQISSLKYTVDLIHYAASQIDASGKVAQEFVSDAVHKGVEITASLPKRIGEQHTKSVESVKKQIHELSSDALKNLNVAVESLAKYVPAPIAAVPHNTYEALKEKITQLTSRLDNLKDLAHFSDVAQKSAALLRQSSEVISAAITKAESTLPPTVVHTVTTTINSALDMLHTIYSPKPAIKDEDSEPKLEEKNE